MDNNPNPPKEPPQPSIGNLGLGTLTTTANEGEPQRKPSQKKTSIFVATTNPNIQSSENNPQTNPTIQSPQTNKISERLPNNPPNNPSNEAKKSKPDGKFPQNNKNQQNPPEDIDLSIEFNLNYLIDSMALGRQLQRKDIGKIMRNFTMYIKDKNQNFSLESIQQTTIIKNRPEKPQFKHIKLPYLRGLQDKSKGLIGLFWTQILHAVCAKLPFLSIQGCYEIIKLQIGLNKHVYCQKNNEGTFNIKLFMDTHLFPILNDKITLDRNHKTFRDVESSIQNLTFILFRHMRLIFKQIYHMKREQKDKYLNVFADLESSSNNKTEIIKNLFSSFENIILKIDETLFEKYAPYFQCITESLWYFYSVEDGLFQKQQCFNFIKFLNDNYIFFNSSVVTTSKSAKNFVEYVEKLVLGLLFKQPFQLLKWQKSLSSFIFKSKLDMFAPFTYLLDYRTRQEINHDTRYYPLRGLHWKEFIDTLIKIKRGASEDMDADLIEFIMNALEAFLPENADLFWADPSNFQTFIDFSIRYNDYSSKKCSNQTFRITILNMMRIATSLMGKCEEQSEHKQVNIIDVEYPQNKKYPFAKNSYVEFSQKFMKIDQHEFSDCICDELRTVLFESANSPNQSEQEEYDDFKVYRPEDIVKTYFLKLLISEPYILFDLKKHFKDIREETLVNFLIIRTIKNPQTSTDLLDLAFSALDTFLTTPKTINLVENILGLGQVLTNKSLPAFAQVVFSIPKNLTFLSRHCNILINNKYQQKEWTIELLKIFSKNCQENAGDGLIKNHKFVISYSQLLSNIVGRLNFDIDPELLQLKPFINIQFVIDTVKHYLRFDENRNKCINMVVEKGNKDKMEALLHAIRVFNTFLLYCLKNRSTKETEQELYTGGQFKSQKIVSVNTQLISAKEAKQLGVGDRKFHLQVKSGNKKEDTTSYANALAIILINSTKQQQKILKQINSDYENLIFETIENLVKINSAQNLIQLFSISQGTGSLIDPMKILGSIVSSKSLLNQFIVYIERSLNPIGIEILIFGKLIQQPERLRKLIDKVRQNLQNPTIRQRTKLQLQMNLISTLSRYFRESMAQMSLHKKDAFTSNEIQEHFEYLIQCIVDFLGPYRSTRKSNEVTIVDNTLSNLYGGFLIVQTLDMNQFAKWLKNYHALLLNQINLKHMRNINNYQFSQEPQPIYTLSKEYFNLLSLFLNCDQYLQSPKFKVIASIKNLPETLSNFILNIAVYSKLSSLPQSYREILLQILTMSLRFYSLIQTNKEQQTSLYAEVLNSVKQQSLKPSTNLILLEIELFNEINAKYSSDEIDFTNFNLWPLQMNCIDSSFSTPTVRKIIESLKNSRLNSTSFVSICNGLQYLIQNSQTLDDSKSTLTKDLFAVYKFFVNQSEFSNSKKLSNSNSILMSKSTLDPTKSQLQSLQYKKVWILELLLVILSTSQNDRKIDNVRFDYERVFMSDDSVLKRFGVLMRKLSFTESQIYMTWLSHLDSSIQQAIPQGEHITYAEKLELNQLLKMFNFILATQSWTSQFADGITELVEAFISYRKIFEKLVSEGKKPRPSSVQQSILEGISLLEFMPREDMMNRSAINNLQRERIIDYGVRSTNSLELMHEILNIELSTQYAMICFTIAQTQHLSMFKRNPLLSDASKWNIVLIEMIKAILPRYLQICRSEKNDKNKTLKTILQGFRESVYLPSDQNLELSTEMLFTNSESLSCCLNGSIELLSQILVETLALLLDRIQVICRKMKGEHHVEHKGREDEFLKVVADLKKMDKHNEIWLRYDPSDRMAMLTQTIRTNITKTVAMKNSYSGMNASNFRV